MKLNKINISRGYRGDEPLNGVIEFAAPDKYKFEVQLTEEQAIEIAAICSDSLARIGRQATEALTADALRHTAIEHKID